MVEHDKMVGELLKSSMILVSPTVGPLHFFRAGRNPGRFTAQSGPGSLEPGFFAASQPKPSPTPSLLPHSCRINPRSCGRPTCVHFALRSSS
jgi:hypothetical protein